MAATGQLSIHLAFVVQLYVPRPHDDELWRGRVEHISSSQVTRFASLAELIAFMERMLTAHKAEPP